MTTALTGVGSTTAVGSVGVNITIPLTGVGAVGAAGRVGALNLPINAVAIRLATPQVALTGATAAAGTLAVRLAHPVVALAGTTPQVARLAVRARAPVVALTALTATTGRLAVRLTAPQVALTTGASVALKIAAPRVALVGAGGGIGALSLRTGVVRVALAGSTPSVGSVAARVPAVQVRLSGVSATAGRLAVQVPLPQPRLHGAPGQIGTLALRLPTPLKVALGGGEGALGTLAVAVPMFQLRLTAIAAVQALAGDATALNTIVMHTERQSLTQYSNYQFNSYAVFAGKYLGARADGIYELVGDSDNGAQIAAVARTGTSDFNTSHLKRVPRVYVGYRSTARMILGVITDETTRRDYAIKGWNIPGLHGSHARIGEGVLARYWQFELRNDRGADFSLDMLEMKPETVKRRIGGRDA